MMSQEKSEFGQGTTYHVVALPAGGFILHFAPSCVLENHENIYGIMKKVECDWLYLKSDDRL